MIDRIRIIPHAPEGIPDCGSFEVWFADGRPSQYFYWDDNPGRASTTRKMDQTQAKEAARALARAERDKLEHTCLLCDGGGWVCEEHPDQPWQGPTRLYLWRRWRALPQMQSVQPGQAAAASKRVRA